MTQEQKNKIGDALRGRKYKKWSDEARLKISLQRKGLPGTNTGKHWKLNLTPEQQARRKEIGFNRRGEKRSLEARRRMSESKKGIKLPPFTAEHKRKISESSKGRKVSEERKLAMSGANCRWWKGGITIITKSIRTMFEYRQWRSDVFTRDGWVCQKCGKKCNALEAHHIKHLSIIIQENNIKTLEDARNCSEMWNTNNGITLCIPCHKEIHKK